RATTVIVLLLFLIAGLAVRDAVLGLSAGGETGEEDTPPPPPRYGDLRLMISLLALLTPVSLVAVGGQERASLLGPFAYGAVSSLGSRISEGERGLRLTAATLHALVASHLVIALRYVIVEVEPEPRSWTWPGYVTMSLAVVVLLTAVLRVVVLVATR